MNSSNLGKVIPKKYGVVTRGEYSATKGGNLIGYRKGECIDDYRDMANAISMGSNSNMPVGLSPCFMAGYNGDWEEDGYCPISKIDRSQCTCDEEFKAPFEEDL